MDDDIRYYGLTLPELIALSVLFQGVKILRSVLLDGTNRQEVL